MRRGLRPDFIYHEKEFIGINLNADFCAQHEWGIELLQRALGIPLDNTLKENFGVESRMMTIYDEDSFFFGENKTHTCFTFEPCRYSELRGWKNSELTKDPEKIASAWDKESFGIVVSNEHKGLLVELNEAFKRKDIAIGLNSNREFEKPGLTIFIASKLPTEVRENTLKQDEKYHRLIQKVLATKIEETLKKANKHYLILSPKWEDEDNEKDIAFWLNPMEQGENNHGWFTLQDLLDWAEDKGPIPKKTADTHV